MTNSDIINFCRINIQLLEKAIYNEDENPLIKKLLLPAREGGMDAYSAVIDYIQSEGPDAMEDDLK